MASKLYKRHIQIDMDGLSRMLTKPEGRVPISESNKHDKVYNLHTINKTQKKSNPVRHDNPSPSYLQKPILLDRGTSS